MRIFIAFILALCPTYLFASDFGYFLEDIIDVEVQSPNWVGFSPAGDYLCLAGDDNIIFLKESPEMWKTVGNIELNDCFGKAEFSPLGEIFIYGDGKEVVLLSLTDLSSKVLFTCNGRISSICFSYGDFLLVGDGDGWIHLWDLKNEIMVWEDKVHDSAVIGLGFSPVQDSFFSVGQKDSLVKEWSFNTRKLQRTLQIEKAKYGEIYTIDVNPFMGIIALAGLSVSRPEGSSAVGSSWEEIIDIRGLENGRDIATLKGHLERINSLSFSPDGKYLASASDDQSIGIWSTEALRETETIDTEDKMKGVSFSPTGRYLAGLSEKGKCYIWRIEGISSSPLYTFGEVHYIPALVSLPQFKGEKKLIAIIPPAQSVEISEELRDSSFRLLSYELLKTERFRIVEREKIDPLLAEMKLALTDIFQSPGESKRFGELLQCEGLVFLEIIPLGENTIFSARLVDVFSGEILLEESEEYQGSIEQISLALGVLARKLALQCDEIGEK